MEMSSGRAMMHEMRMGMAAFDPKAQAAGWEDVMVAYAKARAKQIEEEHRDQSERERRRMES